MIKYKVIESTVHFLKNIEMEYDFSEMSSGTKLSMFGHDMTITQIGGGVIGMANEKNIMIFQELPETPQLEIL